MRIVRQQNHLFSTLEDPGGPWGSRPPLPPRFFQNHAVFRQFLRGNPYFWAKFGLKAPLGSKLHWAPLTKILDLPLSKHFMCRDWYFRLDFLFLASIKSQMKTTKKRGIWFYPRTAAEDCGVWFWVSIGTPMEISKSRIRSFVARDTTIAHSRFLFVVHWNPVELHWEKKAIQITNSRTCGENQGTHVVSTDAITPDA